MELKYETGKLQLYLALLVSTVGLLLPALYNHYPLVNPDTATYLASGFKPETPFDRPITYGLLIRLFSLNGLSLWGVVVAQAYIVAWLLFRIMKGVVSGNYILKSCLLVFILSVTTSLSWIVSQVQPDVFTSIACLTIIVLLMGQEKRSLNVILYILFFVSVAVHLSHPLLMAAIVLLLYLLRGVYTGTNLKQPKRRLTGLFVLSISGLLLMGAALSKSKHVFMMGTLVQKGIVKQYLDDSCATGHYSLCTYKDALPASGDEFMWNDSSPLYKMGGWQAVKPEFSNMIHHVMTSPVYLKRYVAATLQQSGQQAMAMHIGAGNEPLPPGSGVHRRIAEYLPREAATFNTDLQHTTNLNETLVVPNKILDVVVVCSILLLAIACMQWPHMPAAQRITIVVCIAGIVLNCVDCAAFGIVNGRYGSKMIWLLPFCAISFAMTVWGRDKHTSN